MDSKDKEITLVAVHRAEMIPALDSIYGFLLSDKIPREAHINNVQRLVDKHKLSQEEFVELFLYHSMHDVDSLKSEYNLESFVHKTTDSMGIKFRKTR